VPGPAGEVYSAPPDDPIAGFGEGVGQVEDKVGSGRQRKREG